MSGISFGGIASGLPPNLVEQLIEAERIPVRNMERKKSNKEAKLELVTELETKLSGINGSLGSLASTKGFSDIKLETGDSNIVQGTVDPSAGVTGSWNIEVLELAQKAAAITNGFPDKDKTEIGVGYFKFETSDGAKEVYVGGENSTLEGAANAINRSGVGLRATVLNDRKDPDNPYRLVISGEAVGGENAISYPTLYFLDGDMDLYFDETREAKNGRVKVDGFEFEVAANQVDDVIPGVSLALKQASPGKTVNISVKEDLEVVGGKIKSFVDAVNEVLGFIQKQNQLNENSDTSRTLGGDGLLRSIESRLRRLIQGSQMGIKGPIKRLGQLGIQFNRSGTLDFAEETFNKTLASNPDAVQAFFAGDGFSVGFIPAVKRQLAVVLDGSFGPIPLRKQGLNSKIKQMDDRIANKERQLVKKEANLKRKFARMEESISKMKSQGAAMGASGGGGMQGLLG